MNLVSIAVLTQGLGGLLVALLCFTLFTQYHRLYFRDWGLAWSCFVAGLFLDAAGWLPSLAAVCLAWQAVLWACGTRHFQSAGALEIHDKRRAPAPVGARFYAVALVVAAGLAVVVDRLLPSAGRDLILCAVLLGAFSWSAIACVRRSTLTQSPRPAWFLAGALALCATWQLAAGAWAAGRWLGVLAADFANVPGAAALLPQLLAAAALLGLFTDDVQDALRASSRRLAESEDHFRLVFEHSGVGMALLTPQGCFLQVNPALVSLLGFSISELRGRRLIDLAHPDETRSGISPSEQGLEVPPSQYEREKRYIHRDGRTIWARVVRVPLRDAAGQLRYLVAVVMDISERRQAEETLAGSEQRYRLRFEGAFDGIHCCTETGEIVEANAALCRMLGYTMEELRRLTVTCTFPKSLIPSVEIA